MSLHTTVSKCRVDIIHFVNPVLSEDKKSKFLQTETISIEKEILAFEYTKNISQCAGSFTLELTANYNWKARIYAGDWIAVYMTNGIPDPIRGNYETLRMVGNIDRVAQFTTKNDKGLLQTSFVVTGRDWGKMLEMTNLWFDPNNIQELYSGVNLLVGTPSEVIPQILSIFLSGNLPVAVLEKQPQLNQWYLPSELVNLFKNPLGQVSSLPSLDQYLSMNLPILSQKSKAPSLLGSSNPTVDGTSKFTNRASDILKLDIQKTSGYKNVGKQQGLLTGLLWDIIKQNCNDTINELFTEMVYDSAIGMDRPTITLRTKPFTRKSFTQSDAYKSFKIKSDITFFLDLDRVTVKGEEIIGSDLGYSDEERFNFFLLTTHADFTMTMNAIKTAEDYGYPKIQKESVKRHGLRQLYYDTEWALFGTTEKGEISGAPLLLRDWNCLLYEWFNNSIFMESGTIDLEKAHPELRCGKTLVITDSQVNYDKIFYIEGYTDRWQYPGNWHQTVQLTRGQKLDENGEEAYLIDVEQSDTIFTGQTVLTR